MSFDRQYDADFVDGRARFGRQRLAKYLHFFDHVEKSVGAREKDVIGIRIGAIVASGVVMIADDVERHIG